MVCRYNLLNPSNARQQKFENIKVSGLSFHRSKGLEADNAILVGVSEGDYNVPSRIEDAELLSLVIPRPHTYPYAERLFYVAPTRVSRGTLMLPNDRLPARHIRDLVETALDKVRFETLQGRASDICRICMVGTVSDRQQSDGTLARTCTSPEECGNVEPIPVHIKNVDAAFCLCGIIALARVTTH